MDVWKAPQAGEDGKVEKVKEKWLTSHMSTKPSTNPQRALPHALGLHRFYLLKIESP
jgi:hypothetical protein